MADENITNMEAPEEQPQEGQESPLQIPELTDVDMLSSKIVELESNVYQFKDQLLRKAAEFENYKKRVENDYASIIKFSTEDLIVKLVPVLDDFERSLKAIQANAVSRAGGENDSFKQGIEMIYNKLKKLLETQGVKTFESVGKPFDPQYHDALMQVPKPDVPPHIIVDEVEKGYMLHDKVIRHAKVIVSADSEAVGSSAGNAS